MIQRLLALVIDRADVNTALAADGVEFVDENDARRLDFCLLEQIAHPRSADADEHLDEIAAADREERHMRFAGDGAREQRFAGTRWADEQNPFGDFRAEGLVAFRVFEKIHDLLQFIFRFIATGNIAEGDFDGGIDDQARATFPEAQDRFSRAPEPPAEEHPQQQHHRDRHDPRQHDLRKQTRPHAGELDVMRLQFLGEPGVFDPDRAKQKIFPTGFRFDLALDGGLVDFGLDDFIVAQVILEFAVRDLLDRELHRPLPCPEQDQHEQQIPVRKATPLQGVARLGLVLLLVPPISHSPEHCGGEAGIRQWGDSPAGGAKQPKGAFRPRLRGIAAINRRPTSGPSRLKASLPPCHGPLRAARPPRSGRRGGSGGAIAAKPGPDHAKWRKRGLPHQKARF